MPKLPLSRLNTETPSVIRPEVLLDRARTLFHSGRLDQARAICEQVLASDPVNADCLNLLGVFFAQDHRYGDAIAKFESALRVSPDNLDAWRNRGVALSDVGLLDQALASFDQVVAKQPSLTEGHALRAMTLYRLGRFEEAVRAHDPILGLAEQDAAMTANRATALLWSGRSTEAFEAFDRAVALDPNYAPAQLNRALTLLLRGELADGFRGLKWRWKQPALASAWREYPQPLWTGQVPLAGKTILLHREQGFGDTIQFCRYAVLAARRGARVILEVQPALARLMRTLPAEPAGAISVIATGDPVPDFDLHCPLMSLPIGFRDDAGYHPRERPIFVR